MVTEIDFLISVLVRIRDPKISYTLFEYCLRRRVSSQRKQTTFLNNVTQTSVMQIWYLHANSTFPRRDKVVYKFLTVFRLAIRGFRSRAALDKISCTPPPPLSPPLRNFFFFVCFSFRQILRRPFVLNNLGPTFRRKRGHWYGLLKK